MLLRVKFEELVLSIWYAIRVYLSQNHVSAWNVGNFRLFWLLVGLAYLTTPSIDSAVYMLNVSVCRLAPAWCGVYVSCSSELCARYTYSEPSQSSSLPLHRRLSRLVTTFQSEQGLQNCNYTCFLDWMPVMDMILISVSFNSSTFQISPLQAAMIFAAICDPWKLWVAGIAFIFLDASWNSSLGFMATWAHMPTFYQAPIQIDTKGFMYYSVCDL